MDAVHTENHKGFTIKIIPDSDAQSPEEWDGFGTIYTKHNRYFAIGEDLNKIDGQETADDIRTGGGEMLPIYAYVHSGVALSTGSFSCPWDSGQCGFIAATKEQIIKEYGDDTEESRVKARSLMKGEIKTWDTYFQGNVYGFVVEDSKGEHMDSCWGFYGDYEESALPEARAVAAYHAKAKLERKQFKLKAMIKAKAPLTAREQ